MTSLLRPPTRPLRGHCSGRVSPSRRLPGPPRSTVISSSDGRQHRNSADAWIRGLALIVLGCSMISRHQLVRAGSAGEPVLFDGWAGRGPRTNGLRSQPLAMPTKRSLALRDGLRNHFRARTAQFSTASGGMHRAQARAPAPLWKTVARQAPPMHAPGCGRGVMAQRGKGEKPAWHPCRRFRA